MGRMLSSFSVPKREVAKRCLGGASLPSGSFGEGCEGEPRADSLGLNNTLFARILAERI
jgi:hypothetical protein